MPSTAVCEVISMAPDIGWNPLGARGRSAKKRAEKESESGVDVVRAGLVIVALLAIGLGIYLLDNHPGILETAKSMAARMWGMLSDLAENCRRFADSLKNKIS